jgi:hypothetical protein
VEAGRNEEEEEGKKEGITWCGGSLAMTRRFGRWLKRLRWREWWPMFVASEGRRQVVEEREVVGQLPTMDMEVFKMVVTMLVAKGHGVERERERERERFCWQ